MSIEKNKAFVRRYFEALSGKEKTSELLDTYISDDDSELKQHIVGTESTFPLYELIIENLIAEGDQVAVQAIFRGIQNGPMGDMPASGRQVEQPFTIIYRVTEGKIVDHWMAFDRMSFMQQLGMLPEPETPV